MNEITIISEQSLDGTMEAATRLREAIIARGHELAEEGGAILASVTPGENALSIKDAAAKHKEFAARIEDLRDIGKRIVKAALDESHASVVIRQIDDRLMTYSSKGDSSTTYATLSAIAKKIKATIDDRKLAEAPAAPVRAIPCVIYATDEAFRKLCADILGGKRAGMTGYAVAQSEDAERKALKILAPDAK